MGTGMNGGAVLNQFPVGGQIILELALFYFPVNEVF